MSKWLVQVFDEGKKVSDPPMLSVECDTEEEANREFSRLCEEYPSSPVMKRKDPRKVLNG